MITLFKMVAQAYRKRRLLRLHRKTIAVKLEYEGDGRKAFAERAVAARVAKETAGNQAVAVMSEQEQEVVATVV